MRMVRYSIKDVIKKQDNMRVMLNQKLNKQHQGTYQALRG